MRWERGVTEVEVVDSDVAPVCGLSLSIARESDDGGGEEKRARMRLKSALC